MHYSNLDDSQATKNTSKQSVNKLCESNRTHLLKVGLDQSFFYTLSKFRL